MKRHIDIVIPMCIAVLAVGCPSDGGRTAADPQSGKSADEQRDRMKAETKQAAQAAEDYAYARKAEFVAEMQQDLDRMQIEIDRLQAEVVATTGAAKADAQRKLDEVRKKWADAKQRLDAAESATESTWEAVKTDAKRAHGELKQSFDDTRQWLSDKIEPPS